MTIHEKKPFNLSTKFIPSSQNLIHIEDKLQTTQKTKSKEQLEIKFIELYNDSSKLNKKKQKLRQELNTKIQLQQREACTFHPQINPEKQSYTIKGSGSFLKRQTDWMTKKERKINEMSRQMIKKQKQQCSFQPKISRKTYAILNKTTTKIQNNQSEVTLTPEGLNDSFRQSVGSYRQIHMKKECYKELQQSNSFQSFNLVTERRQLERAKHNLSLSMVERSHFHDEQFSFSSINLPSTVDQLKNHQQSYDDYIQNIVIKTEEQDTFNSLESLEMKGLGKVNVEENKQILEEEKQKEDDADENVEQDQDQNGNENNDQSGLLNEQNIELLNQQNQLIGENFILHNQQQQEQDQNSHQKANNPKYQSQTK